MSRESDLGVIGALYRIKGSTFFACNDFYILRNANESFCSFSFTFRFSTGSVMRENFRRMYFSSDVHLVLKSRKSNRETDRSRKFTRTLPQMRPFVLFSLGAKYISLGARMNSNTGRFVNLISANV